MTSGVKAPLVLAAFIGIGQLGVGGVATAQQADVRPAKSAKVVHERTRARPIEIPQQTAPPQEAFASAPEKASVTPLVPSVCDLRLPQVAVFHPLSQLIAPGECGAEDAVQMDAVIMPDQSKVAISPPATLRCTMAAMVAQWVRDDVGPAAAKLGSPLRMLENLGSYECRGRDRVRGATLSEHGRANALDVHAFKFANGQIVVLADVKAPKDFRDAVRLSACAHFSTVLGPGSDEEHAEHVHLDLAERRNNYKICEWDVREPLAEAKATGPIPPDEVPLPQPRPVLAEDEAQPPSRRSEGR